MTLSIKDDRTDALARKLAALTGRTITEAVRDALEDQLRREKRRRVRAGLADRLVKIGQRSAAAIGHGVSALDHGDLLYDERGLPR